MEFARPYTPDDNAWIEAFIKYMKYHPECPDSFKTVKDVTDWIAKFQKLYNNHPHSSLGYVRPNEEHAGLGDAIRQLRKDNLLSIRQKRLEFYKTQKAKVSEYGSGRDTGSTEPLCQNSRMRKLENNTRGEIEALKGEDFQQKSSEILCQNR